MTLKYYLARLYAKAFRAVYLYDVDDAKRTAVELAARLASHELNVRIGERQIRRAVRAVMREKGLSRLRLALPNLA